MKDGQGRRRWRFGVSFLMALLMTVWLGRLPLAAQVDTLEPVPPANLPIPITIPVDISQHWAGECIRGLAERGFVKPNDLGLFLPDEPITWAAYTQALNLVFPTGTVSRWASPLEQALGLTDSASVASHYPAQYYQPDRPLVRAEAVMALAAKLEVPYITTANAALEAGLADADQIPEYAREGVAAALMRGLLVNYPEARQFNPNRPLTRGEAAALICQASPEDTDLHRSLDPAWIPATPAIASPQAPSRELRGVWLTNIDSQVLFSRENLEAGITRLADLNFNTLYPTVWNWGYTLYPSAIAEQALGDRQHLYGENSTPAREAEQAERDMLQEAIELGHARGMKVIPWFEFGFMAPADYPLYRNHPDWFTQKRPEPPPEPAADAIFPDADPLEPEELPSPGPEADPEIWMEGGVIPRRWLNPFHPQAQKFLLDLINELMTRYPVDGLQVDDHLGLPVEFGYDPYTMALYAAEHEGQAPPEDAQDPEWVRWRANKISDFMGALARVVKAQNPNAIVSVSPNPYPFAYVNYLQDWPEWERRGLVDELVIQVYRDNQQRFIWEMNKPSAQTSRRSVPTSIGILSGLRALPVALPWIRAQIDAVRDREFAGVSFFFYETLWMGPEPPEQRVLSLKEAFPNAAEHPSRS